MDSKPSSPQNTWEGDSEFSFQFWTQLFLWIHLFGRLVSYILRNFRGLK